jgi:hypothetical protein
MASDDILNALLGVLQGSQRGAQQALTEHMARRSRREELEQMQQNQIELLQTKAPLERENAQFESDLTLGRERTLRAEEPTVPLYRTDTEEFVQPPEGSKKFQVFTPPTLKESTEEKENAKRNVKLKATQPQAYKSKQGAIASLEALKKEAEDILGNSNLGYATGASSFLGAIPGTVTKDIRARIETLKAKSAFSTLQAMRDASKTGGALGQTSDREMALLQNAITALDLQQSDAGFKDSLTRLIQSTDESIQNLEEGYNLTYGSDDLPTINVQTRGSGEKKDTSALKDSLKRKLGLK